MAKEPFQLLFRYYGVLPLLIALLGALTWPTYALESHSGPGVTIRVLWLSPGTISGDPFSMSFDQARAQIEDDMMNDNVTILSEVLYEARRMDCGPETLKKIEAGIGGGQVDLVVAGGSILMTCFANALEDERYQDLKYLVVGSGVPKFQVGVAEVWSHQAAYLHGKLCASVTTTGHIGMIGTAMRTTASGTRAAAAFATGARTINPNINIHLGILNYVTGTIAPRKATTKLALENNVDCMVSGFPSLDISTTMASLNRYSTGLGIDARIWSNNELVLSSALWNFVPAIIPSINMVRYNNWTAFYTEVFDMSTNVMPLAGFSSVVPPKLADALFANATQLASTNQEQVFCTPHWDDPLFRNDTNMEEVSPGRYCLNRAALATMIGIPTGVHVAVEWDSEEDAIEVLQVTYSHPGAVVVMVLCGSVIAVSIGTIIHIIVYRNHPIYVSSSSIYFILMLIGCIIMGSVGFIRPEPTTAKCLLKYWLTGLGISIILACLAAKIWRIFRVYSSSRLRTVKILNHILIPKFLGAFCGVMTLVLIIITIGDPWYAGLSTFNPSLRYDQKQWLCLSAQPRFNWGFALYIATVFFLHIPVAFIAFRGRHAKNEYTDSHGTYAVVYFMTTIILVIGFTSLFSSPGYISSFYLDSISSLSPVAVWGILMLPKIVLVHKSNSSGAGSTNTALTSYNATGFNSILPPSRVSQPTRNSFLEEDGGDSTTSTDASRPDPNAHDPSFREAAANADADET